MAFRERLSGQGASEYLMLLGAVLIVSLVAASLLGFFPGSAAEVPSTQSQIYWSGYASPFSVRDALYVSTGSCAAANASPGPQMLLKNTEKWSMNLTAVYLNGNSTAFCVAGATVGATSIPFNSGEEKVVATLDSARTMCANRTKLPLDVSFRYNNPYSQNKLQIGAEKLIVPCQ